MAFHQFAAFLFSVLLIQQKLISGESTATSLFTTTEESSEAVTDSSTTAVPQTSHGVQFNLKFVCSFSYKIYNETVKNGTQEIVRASVVLHPVCCTGYKWNGSHCVPHCAGGCGEGVCKFPDMCICEKKFQYCHFGNYSRPSPREAVNVSCLENCNNGFCLPNNTCQCNKGFRHLDDWTRRYTNSSAECVPFCFPFCSNKLFSTPEECACLYSYQEDDGGSIDFHIDKPKSFNTLKQYFNKYGHPNFGTGASLHSAAGHVVGSNNSFGPIVLTKKLNGKPASPGTSSGIGSNDNVPPRHPFNFKPASPGTSSGIGSNDNVPHPTGNPFNFKPAYPWSSSAIGSRDNVPPKNPFNFKPASPGTSSGIGSSDNVPHPTGNPFNFKPPSPWSSSGIGSNDNVPHPTGNPFNFKPAYPWSSSGIGSSDNVPPKNPFNFKPASPGTSSGIGSSDNVPPRNPFNFKPASPGSSSGIGPFDREPIWTGGRGVGQEAPWIYTGPLGRAKPSSGSGSPPATNNFGSSFRGPVGSGNPLSDIGLHSRINNFGSDIGFSGSNFPEFRKPSGINIASINWDSIKPIGHKWDIPKINPNFHSSHIGGTKISTGGFRGGFRFRG